MPVVDFVVAANELFTGRLSDDNIARIPIFSMSRICQWSSSGIERL